MKLWWVYILRCSDKTLYTGASNDLKKRIAAHNVGKGAKYIKGRCPAVLVYSEPAADKSSAFKRECQIKKFSREEKENLIKTWPI